MAGLSERPNAFFRLSPVANGIPFSFAIRRGEIAGRFDAKYFAFHEQIESTHYPLVALGTLVREEPAYGSGARAVSRKSADQPRYIRITDFGEDGIEPDHEFVTADPIESDCFLAANDLLFARSGATVGKTYLHEDTSEPGIFAGYCIRFRFDVSKALPRFVYWWTKTSAYLRWVATIQRPAGQPNINKEEFKSCLIPLPGDVSEQGLLVATMDMAREDRRAKFAQADALVAGLDAFVLETLGLTRPPDDPRRVFGLRHELLSAEGRFDPNFHHPKYARILAILRASPVPKVPLGQLSPELVGGATPTRGSTEFYAPDGVKFLRILNVKPNEFDFSDLNYIRAEVHEGELKRSQLRENDVLMTITGRVGNAAVVTSSILPANINQHIVRLRLVTNDVSPDYLAVYLNSSVGLALSNRAVTGGTRVALDYGAIRTLQIPVPSHEVQSIIVAEMRRRREEACRLRAEAEAGWQGAKHWFEEQLLGGDIQ